MSQSPRILVSDEEYKVYKFSGLPIHWRRWKGRFIARATLKGLKDILTGNPVVPPETENAGDSDEIKEARLLNYVAYSTLMGINDGVAFDLIETCFTDENISGNAKLA